MLQPDPDLARARETTRTVARTFGLACRLLPRAVRDDVYRLYLVFRTLDDLVDDGDPRAAEAVAAVADWAAGAPPRSEEARLLAVIDACRPLPRDALADFCRGMQDDLAGTPVRTEADLERYCYRVAGTVGVVMAALLGADASAYPAAAALGKAMQRTNILRDIDEDLAAGRCYLPYDAASLAPGARAALVRAQIARADELYDEGIAGITQLPRGRIAIRAAAAMYREILRQIERDGFAAGRARVSLGRKLRVAVRA